MPKLHHDADEALDQARADGKSRIGLFTAIRDGGMTEEINTNAADRSSLKVTSDVASESPNNTPVAIRIEPD